MEKKIMMEGNNSDLIGGESGIRSFVSLRSLQRRALPRIRSVRPFESTNVDPPRSPALLY